MTKKFRVVAEEKGDFGVFWIQWTSIQQGE